MSKPAPAAFLSYVHSDDLHDRGGISNFREQLEGEIRMQMGTPFSIFQDRNDLMWGQAWKERIDQSLNDVTFLIPIITPSFFQSPYCIQEFITFSRRESTLGIKRLILPLYYVTCDEMELPAEGSDEVISILKERQWTDWRKFRFRTFDDAEVREELALLATTIKASIKEIYEVFRLADQKAVSVDDKRAERVEILTDLDVQGSLEVVLKGLDEGSRQGPIVAPGSPRPKKRPVRKPPYKVFTTRFDEVVTVEDLLSPEETQALYDYLSPHSSALEKENNAALERQTTLMRALSSNNDVAISLLIDNSGSLRGNPIRNIAAWSLIVLDIWEKFGIDTAATGFTTRAWKGGQSREAWLAAGRPPRPGRLNDLRYVLYKKFGRPLRDCAQNFGLMIREGILKENIDGEALEWAAQALRAHQAKTKILVVISDGAPVDDSTLSANDHEFLVRHLRTVIRKIKADQSLRLIALGVDFDVNRYYGDSGFGATQSNLGLVALRRVNEILLTAK